MTPDVNLLLAAPRADCPRGRRADGSGFSDFDTLADVGVTLEVCKTAR